MKDARDGSPRKVAGLVHARCSCCAQRQLLARHRDLDATRLICPETGKAYLDRGDGVFEADGTQVDLEGIQFVLPSESESTPRPAAPAEEAPGEAAGSADARAGLPAVQGPSTSPDLLSDRPRRTGPKTRIELERATFAAASAREGGTR